MSAEAASEDPWREALRKVYRLWGEGDTAEAEEALNELARRFPHVPMIPLARAQAILVRAGGFAFVADAEIARGRQLVQDAIAPNEADVDTLVMAAVLACDFEDFDTAARFLRHLRPLEGEGMGHVSDGDVAPYFNVLGRVALHRGDHALAEEFARAAYEQDRTHGLYVATLAQALAALGDISAALSLLHDARQKDPSNSDLRVLEGLLANAARDPLRRRWKATDASRRRTDGPG